MIFTYIGLAIAWLLFAPSALFLLVVGWAFGTDNIDLLFDIVDGDFLLWTTTIVRAALVGLALGIAAEISRSVAKRNQ